MSGVRGMKWAVNRYVIVGEPALARKCNRWYQLAPKNGGVMGPPTDVARFWAKVRKGDGCWEWIASVQNSGYGQFFPVKAHMVTAHRYSYELHFGPVPEGLHVCHHCDNRICVRPDHLYAGTRSDNMRDAWSRGRMTNPLVRANQVKTHCKRGHPFAGDNLYVTSKGWRRCRACGHAASRRWTQVR